MTYKTSLDNWAKGITIGFTLLFISIIFGQFAILEKSEKGISIIIIIILITLYLITFALRPVSYSLTTEFLIIDRLIKNVKIDRKTIKLVEVLDKESLSWSIRTFGVGGLFGYFGKFANTKLGSMTWYATRRDRTVLVQTIDNKKIILTPDEPEIFVNDFNR